MSYIIIGIAALIVYPLLSIAAIQEKAIFIRSTIVSILGFQTFLYAAIMCRKQTLKVAPSLLYIHRAASENYSPVIEMGAPRQPKIPVSNFAFYEDEFRERLSALLKEIYNPEETFSQTEDNGKCEYCDFRSLCKK